VTTTHPVVESRRSALYGPGPSEEVPVRLTRGVAAVLTAFFVVRPSLDILTTFEVGPNLNTVVGGALLAVLAGWLIVLATDARFDLPAPGVAALALGFAAIASALGSVDPAFSASMALRVVTASLVFVAAEQLAHAKPTVTTRLVVAIVAGLGLTALVAIGQLAEWFPLPTDDSIDNTRVPGPFPAPTVFATCMVICVVLIVGLGPLWWRRAPNLIWVLGPVAIGFTYLLLANGSRSPLGALVLGLVAAAVVQRRTLLLAPAVAMAAAVTVLRPSLLDRFFEVFDTSEGSILIGAETNTMVFRLRYWERNLPRVEESPLIGIGIGRVEQVNGEGFPPHSTTVQSLIEMGVIGLIAHYIFITVLAVALVRAARRTRSIRVRTYLSVAIGLSLGYFAMSFFENLLTQVVTTAPLAAVVGLALGLERAERAGRVSASNSLTTVSA
jgi:hypothetical protein